MLVCEGLAPDGSKVSGFRYEDGTVTFGGVSPIDASVRISLQLLSLRDGVLRNEGEVAAVGVVTDGDVLDLLPGESVAIEGTRAEGWNARL